ncbi:uncharacterized protein RHO25_005936 [Cercospora beticola]|uniref:Uncharacterized protein n=1 Tax=Cercospora beticola TaxID=122368 RepID=A0ABZ0NP48_CERBT|nr:hypothetical protein RHO25_005936 [Cercospora beticola]
MLYPCHASSLNHAKALYIAADRDKRIENVQSYPFRRPQVQPVQLIQIQHGNVGSTTCEGHVLLQPDHHPRFPDGISEYAQHASDSYQWTLHFFTDSFIYIGKPFFPRKESAGAPVSL